MKTKKEHKKKSKKLSRKITSVSSQEPGPSHIRIDSSDPEFEFSEDDDQEPCCVCGKVYADEIQQSTYVIFVNWAQCDKCGHWVHLTYCSSVRVIRIGDTFLCPHCIEE